MSIRCCESSAVFDDSRRNVCKIGNRSNVRRRETKRRGKEPPLLLVLLFRLDREKYCHDKYIPGASKLSARAKRESRFHKRISSKSQHAIQSRARGKSRRRHFDSVGIQQWRALKECFYTQASRWSLPRRSQSSIMSRRYRLTETPRYNGRYAAKRAD